MSQGLTENFCDHIQQATYNKQYMHGINELQTDGKLSKVNSTVMDLAFQLRRYFYLTIIYLVYQVGGDEKVITLSTFFLLYS